MHERGHTHTHTHTHTYENTECPKKIVPFSKIFLWAPDVILELESFIYQKLGNKSKFFSTLQRFNMGALRDTADI